MTPAKIVRCAAPKDGFEFELIDFGSALRVDDSDACEDGGVKAATGEPDYRAPEMSCQPCVVTAAADIWSLGVTKFDLVSGRLPATGPAGDSSTHRAAAVAGEGRSSEARGCLAVLDGGPGRSGEAGAVGDGEGPGGKRGGAQAQPGGRGPAGGGEETGGQRAGAGAEADGGSTWWKRRTWVRGQKDTREEKGFGGPGPARGGVGLWVRGVASGRPDPPKESEAVGKATGRDRVARVRQVALGRRFAAALLPRLFGTNPRSHHKGTTGRVRTGDQRLPVLCRC